MILKAWIRIGHESAQIIVGKHMKPFLAAAVVIFCTLAYAADRVILLEEYTRTT